MRYFEIKWICWPKRHIQPVTGNIFVFFSKHESNYICYVNLFILWLIVSKRLSKLRYFGDEMKKVLAYEAATTWNRGIPCIFFKTLIQLYLLRSFLYYLTYCIREVIKGKLFWILNEKSSGLWGSNSLKQGNPVQLFQNTDPIVFVLFIFLFWLTVSKRVSKAIFLDIKCKSVGLWGRYVLK